MATYNNLTFNEFLNTIDNEAVTPLEIEAVARLTDMIEMMQTKESIQNRIESIYDTFDALFEDVDQAIDHINDDLCDDIQDNVSKYLSDLQNKIDTNRENADREYSLIEFV